MFLNNSDYYVLSVYLENTCQISSLDFTSDNSILSPLLRIPAELAMNRHQEETAHVATSSCRI